MPYIGRNHIAGDHTSNFKVLDDISSFTATFDGSASSVVDTTNNTIRVVEHRFIQGQRVTYTNGGGGNIGGLTTGTVYFVIFDSASTIKLATSASNAANNTVINLSAVGSGTSHTLNAAFDGVNTKFKITYNGGTGARFNNATQLNIAINNVLQKPNTDSLSYTEGFAIEDNHKIVFKVAPTSEDIFWGSIIANTLTTFDISDHKIDTFTGDGSTTEFNLSHTPANNESLMVTINGVLQHPSNASTARAYTLIANVIQFTAAPGVGDEIQVRHLGFAGATTADVSGFYGRTGNVVLTSNDHITTGDITARNINASGILTASSASFSGNVSIGGTLTYEDVSNIDSVGIITARNGIDCNGDIDVDGHTNLDNVSVAGVTTFSNTVHVGTGVTIETNGNSNFVGVSSLGTGATGAVYLYNPDADALSGTTNDIYGWKAKTYTSGLQVNSTLYLSRSGTNGLSLNYNNATGGYINQSVGFLNISCPGGLPIYYNAYQHQFRSPPGKDFLIMNNSNDQAVHLYQNDVLRFSTTSSGVNVVGTTTSTQLAVTGVSTFTGAINANGDLDVDGHTNLDNVSIAGVTTASGMLNANGDMTITSPSPTINFTENNGDPDYRIFLNGGIFNIDDVTNNVQKFSINTTRITLNGTTLVNDNTLYVGRDIVHWTDDNTKIRFPAADTITAETGGSERLRIHSTGQISANVNNNSYELTIGGLSGGPTLWLRDSGTTGSPRILFGDTSAALIGGITYNNSSDHMEFATNGTERLRIDSAGRVGIGTDTMDSSGNLNITDTAAARIYMKSGDSSDCSIYFGSFNDAATGGIRYDHSDDSLRFMGYNNSEYVRILGGALLVNRTAKYASSSEKLSVNGMTSIQGSSTSTAPLYVFNTDTTGSGTVQPFIYLHDGSGIRGGLGLQYSTSNFVINANNVIQFRTGSSGVGGSERARIDSVGRVMIGTTTEGNGNADEFTISYINHAGVSGGDQGRCGMTIRSGDNTSGVTQNGYIYFSDGTSGANESKGVVAYEHSTDSMYLSTNQVARLRIDSNGKIGIGENSPDSLLHVTTNSSTAYSTSEVNTVNSANTLLRLENTNGGDGSGVNNYVGIYFRVANGANSDSQLQYVRTGDNAGAFHFKARNAGSSYPNLVTMKSDGNTGFNGTIDPKSTIHFGSNQDLRIGGQYGGLSQIMEQVEYTAGYTGTHWQFETNNMISWSFDGVLIVYGGGGSTYGSEVVKITIVYSRESGANNSGDTWRNGTTSYNIETLGHGQTGLSPSSGSLTVTEDTAPDGAASTRSLFKLGWSSAATGGSTTVWSKLHGTIYWGTGSSGSVEVQDKDGNIFWNSNP